MPKHKRKQGEKIAKPASKPQHRHFLRRLLKKFKREKPSEQPDAVKKVQPAPATLSTPKRIEVRIPTKTPVQDTYVRDKPESPQKESPIESVPEAGIREKLESLTDKSYLEKRELVNALAAMGKDARFGERVVAILLDEFAKTTKIYSWFLLKMPSPFGKHIREGSSLDSLTALLEEAVNHKDEDISELGKRVAEKRYKNPLEIMRAFLGYGWVCYHLKEVLVKIGDAAVLSKVREIETAKKL